MSLKRFIYNWSQQVDALWCGNTGCSKFLIKVPFDYKKPMIITGHKITNYGHIEIYGKFVDEKQSESNNRNGSTSTERNKGLRYFE